MFLRVTILFFAACICAPSTAEAIRIRTGQPMGADVLDGDNVYTSCGSCDVQLQPQGQEVVTGTTTSTVAASETASDPVAAPGASPVRELGECLICQVQPDTGICEPCGHGRGCVECMHQWHKHHGGTCQICKEPVARIRHAGFDYRCTLDTVEDLGLDATVQALAERHAFTKVIGRSEKLKAAVRGRVTAMQRRIRDRFLGRVALRALPVFFALAVYGWGVADKFLKHQSTRHCPTAGAEVNMLCTAVSTGMAEVCFSAFAGHGFGNLCGTAGAVAAGRLVASSFPRLLERSSLVLDRVMPPRDAEHFIATATLNAHRLLDCYYYLAFIAGPFSHGIIVPATAAIETVWALLSLRLPIFLAPLFAQGILSSRVALLMLLNVVAFVYDDLHLGGGRGLRDMKEAFEKNILLKLQTGKAEDVAVFALASIHLLPTTIFIMALHNARLAYSQLLFTYNKLMFQMLPQLVGVPTKKENYEFLQAHDQQRFQRHANA